MMRVAKADRCSSKLRTHSLKAKAQSSSLFIMGVFAWVLGAGKRASLCIKRKKLNYINAPGFGANILTFATHGQRLRPLAPYGIHPSHAKGYGL